jgi:MFS transporter, NNP family, nitrate/nitrite transporter
VGALLPLIGFSFSANQLFWLVALPGLVGATMRSPYTFLVQVFGGRNWTIISALLLLVPTVSLGFPVQNPGTPFWAFALVAAAGGFGDGNFSSSMVNTNYFYPAREKGFSIPLARRVSHLGPTQPVATSASPWCSFWGRS